MMNWKLIALSTSVTLFFGITSGVAEEAKQVDLETQKLIAHIAFQLGKDDGLIPKALGNQQVATENGVLSASINELTPVSGSKFDASKVQSINCNAKFDWPNQKVAITDEEVPIIMILSYKERNSGHVWTGMGKPIVRVNEGIRPQPEMSMGHEGTLPPGDYSVTAMLFARLSPEKPPTLLDVKTTEFVVETPNK